MWYIDLLAVGIVVLYYLFCVVYLGGVSLRRGAQPVGGVHTQRGESELFPGISPYSEWGGGGGVTALQNLLRPCTCKPGAPLSSPILESCMDPDPSLYGQNLIRGSPLWESSCGRGGVSLSGIALPEKWFHPRRVQKKIFYRGLPLLVMGTQLVVVDIPPGNLTQEPSRLWERWL